MMRVKVVAGALYAAVDGGFGVGEVGGHEVAVAEVVEYVLCGGKLVVRERAEVENGEGFGGANRHPGFAGLLTAGVPPV